MSGTETTKTNVAPTEGELSVSEQNAHDLLQILFQRGYFHTQTTPMRSATVSYNQPATKVFPGDPILLERTSKTGPSPSFCTVDHLVEEGIKILNETGRLNLKEGARTLGVDTLLLSKYLVPRVDGGCLVVKDLDGSAREIVTRDHVNVRTKVILSHLETHGILSLEEATDEVLKVPHDEAVSILRDKVLSDSVVMRRHGNGRQSLVTDAYWNDLKQEVRNAFLSHEQGPVEMTKIARDNDWDTEWVRQVVSDGGECLPGEFHGDVYVPHSHLERQRQSVLDLFHSNGYISTHLCHGISKSDIKHVLEKCNGVLALSGSVWVQETVLVDPLVAVVEEAMDDPGWMDLQNHFPLDLLEHHREETRQLVQDHVLSQITTECTLCIESDGALLFAEPFLRAFRDDRLSSLVRTQAKKHALLIMALDEEESQSAEPVSGKEKRRVRDSAKAKKYQHVTSDVPEFSIPLDNIVSAFVDARPDLQEIKSSSSALSGACRDAFCTDSFDVQCASVLKEEINRLKKKNQEKKPKDALVNFKNIESAFEDSGCFATACYMVQTRSKFVTYTNDSNFDDIDGIEVFRKRYRNEFLQHCCADFTGRVTQYVLYRNDVDGSTFSFFPNSGAGDEEIQSFYDPVELVARSKLLPYLSLKEDSSPGDNDPLKVLRDVLPGTVGINLARQWILCGGESFQGGAKQGPDGTFVRLGDTSKFLEHVEENCLTLCGLPFSKLDKKAEKKFLNARRQRLMALLDDATDAEAALDLRIALLYQLVKNMVVLSGPHTRIPLLSMLSKERKTSSSEVEVLIDIARKVSSKEPLTTEELNVAKGRQVAC